MGDSEDTPLEDMADDDDDGGGDEGRGRGKDGRWRLGMGIITEKGRNQTLVNPVGTLGVSGRDIGPGFAETTFCVFPPFSDIRSPRMGSLGAAGSLLEYPTVMVRPVDPYPRFSSPGTRVYYRIIAVSL